MNLKVRDKGSFFRMMLDIFDPDANVDLELVIAREVE